MAKMGQNFLLLLMKGEKGEHFPLISKILVNKKMILGTLALDIKDIDK